jgi:predicted AlkP superfamily pyrophosphatase or phosphodiesterase
VASFLVHRYYFDWKPDYPDEPTREINSGEPLARRVIVVVIDGCRLDRFREAEKPYLERMMARGTVYESVETAYPARTVVCFSSMFTGAAPERHGIASNLVLKLGLRVESVFDVLRRRGKVGKLVGIAHLIDAFGHEDVASVTSVAHNDKIDGYLIAAARRELEEHDPDLLVLQLLAVDQNGHVRGTYYPEYVERIEITDGLIEEFMSWCEEKGYLEDAAVILMADHGQGRGIGAHGHLSEGERFVPFAMWGKGIAEGRVVSEPRSILDLAPTISYLLGVEPPSGSTGRVLTRALERGDS